MLDAGRRSARRTAGAGHSLIDADIWNEALDAELKKLLAEGQAGGSEGAACSVRSARAGERDMKPHETVVTCVGLNHETSPVEERERLAFSAERAAAGA